MNKHILVTGGAGFLGSHLVDALLVSGYQVRVLDSLSEQVHGQGEPDYLSAETEFIRGDTRDTDLVRRALDGIDVVVHLAAAVGVGQSMYEIARYVGANIQGTAVLLQELLHRKSRVQKMVLASSMSVYGEGSYRCANCGPVSPGLRSAEQLRRKQWETACPNCGIALTALPTDESKSLQASSIYALTKKDQEEMCLLFGRTYGLPVVALRYFNIYGPRQALSNPYTGVAAIFASRLLNGNPPLVFEDGGQLRDFVSVEDVVQATMLAIERSGADGRALNVGSGDPISIGEVATGLARALRARVRADFTEKYRSGDIRHCFADIAAARQLLGYTPRVRFGEGINGLVRWLRSQQPQDRAAEAVAQLSSFGLTA